MSNSSQTEHFSFEFVYRVLLYLVSTGLFNVISSQELRVLVMVLIRQVSEDSPRIKAIVTDMSKEASISKRALKKALASLEKRKLVEITKASRDHCPRAARPFWICVPKTVQNFKGWPDLPWDEVDRLAGPTMDWLSEVYEQKRREKSVL